MRRPTMITIIGDEIWHRRIATSLTARGYRTHICSVDGRRAGAARPTPLADAVLVRLPPATAPEPPTTLVARVRAEHGMVPIVAISRQSSEREARALLAAGATHYFDESISVDHLDVTIRLALETPAPDRRRVRAPDRQRPLLGTSAAMQEVQATVTALAGADANVLITGETGTGKELVAEALHTRSATRRGPFVRVNCAAIPDTLLESELFGHERGAFTGADAPREGLMTLAHHGTIFFDEIGDMSALGQAKILRAIETKEIRRVGGRGTTSVNMRVVAATNRDVESAVADGHLRADLYFRLNVARIHLPPLRDRREDIALLAAHYLVELNRDLRCDVSGFATGVLDSLLRYDWPGNVRELRNVIESALLRARTGRIEPDHLPEYFQRRLRSVSTSVDERARLLAALLASNWNKSRAASELSLSRMTLYRRMAKYSIQHAFPEMKPRQMRGA